jgi:hypothetical protein
MDLAFGGIVNPVLRRAPVQVVRLDLVVIGDWVRLFSAPMQVVTLDLLGVLVLRKIPLVLHAFLQWERLNRWSQDGGS